MDEYKFTLGKAFLHLKTIIIHKHFVFKYCCKCGIPWQGIIHDLSKFSPSEFFTNVKYTKQGISPIDVQKEVVGYSFPWQHHKGHNPHHYEFWMDRFDNGCYVHRMPFEYMVECMCDQLAANRAYNGRKATYTGELKWWKVQREVRNIHPDCTKFLDCVFGILSKLETDTLHKDIWDSNTGIVYNFNSIDDVFDKDFLKRLYDRIVETSKYNSPTKIRQPNAFTGWKPE